MHLIFLIKIMPLTWEYEKKAYQIQGSNLKEWIASLAQQGLSLYCMIYVELIV